MSDQTDMPALFQSIKLLAIGNACWVVPGLIPSYGPFGGFDVVRSVLNWVASILAFVFMVRAARKAAQRNWSMQS